MSRNAAILSSILLIGCVDVFIPDPINPELPKYTEQGLNMAGAYVGEKLWRAYSSGFCLFCGYDSFHIEQNTNGIWALSLRGELPDAQLISFYFHLDGLDLSPDAIISQHGKKIELDGVTRWVDIFQEESNCPEIKRGKGQIYFRSIKKQPNTIHHIVSGTFSMQFDDAAGCQATVTYGRFDFVYYSN